mgnify:CR=1 FL=1
MPILEPLSKLKLQTQKAVEFCCKDKGVPRKCMGFCMTDCKVRSPGVSELLSRKTTCTKSLKIYVWSNLELANTD